LIQSEERKQTKNKRGAEQRASITMGVNYSHLRDVVRVLGLNLSNGRYLARNDVEILFKLVPNKNITVQNLVKWRTKVK